MIAKSACPVSRYVLTRRFAELVLKGYVKAGLIEPEVKNQILSQEHTGFSVWIGDLINDAESKHFLARYMPFRI
jgi:hypothetical protein